jgi:hypothetical protein
VHKVIKKCLESIVEQIHEKELSGSQWMFQYAINAYVIFYKYTPFIGRGYLPTPEWLKGSKSIVNIKNNDDSCYFWCILRYAFPYAPNRHVDRITDLKNKMYLFDQKTRMELAGNFTEENLKRFERASGLRINIYLIGENKGEVDPYYLSDNEEGNQYTLG